MQCAICGNKMSLNGSFENCNRSTDVIIIRTINFDMWRLPKAIVKQIVTNVIIGNYRTSKLNEVENALNECTISRSFVYVFLFFFLFSLISNLLLRNHIDLKENVKINSIRIKFCVWVRSAGCSEFEKKNKDRQYAHENKLVFRRLSIFAK